MIWNAEQNIQLRPAEGTSGVSSICVPTSAGCFIGDKMKRILLTQGQYAIVDDEDFEWLSKYKWCALWNKNNQSFYAVRSKSKKEHGKASLISMARQILRLSYGDKRNSDHINHNTLDNRKSKLRIVSCQQNQFNRKSPKGYYWHKAVKKYHARIKVNGKNIYLGLFVTAKEARNAYLKAKEIYHKV